MPAMPPMGSVWCQEDCVCDCRCGIEVKVGKKIDCKVRRGENLGVLSARPKTFQFHCYEKITAGFSAGKSLVSWF